MTRKIIVVFITLFISLTSFAQISSTSVYSFFGIGDRNNFGTTEQLSMGGVGVALAEPHRINFSNPAANASLQFTNYTLGLVSKNAWTKQNDNSENAAATYVSYFAMAFNIGDKAGVSFGMLPNTSVGYNLISREYDDDEEEVLSYTAYSGEGGTSKVFLNFGYNLAKGLNIGIQGDYVFGKIETYILDQQKDASLATKYETITNVSGFSFDAGIQYKKEIKQYLNVLLGANFNFENKNRMLEKEFLYSVPTNTLTIVPRDTLLSNANTAYFKNPLKSTLGVGVGRDHKWYAGIDYTFQNPLSVENSIYEKDVIQYGNYSKIAIGGFYTPKYNSILSYWNRITYRAGVRFENTGITLDADKDGLDYEPIKDFGINFGVGFPVGKQVSNLNFGFEYGKRGNVSENIVQENYFNFRLSISLNDKWFEKRQIF
jgi:hypothetical protein